VPPVRTGRTEIAVAESEEEVVVDADLAEVGDSADDAGSAALRVAGAAAAGAAVGAAAVDSAHSVELDAAAEGRGSVSYDLHLLGSSENCASESTLQEFATQSCNRSDEC
jgi:hypothetical protein